MHVSALIPFTSTDPWRQQALQHTIASYEHLGYEIVIGATPAPWSKARAVEAAARRASGDILVVADADCLSGGITEAVQAVADGAPWAIPHLGVARLTEQATADLHAGRPVLREDLDEKLEEPLYRAWVGGGIVVVPARTWHEVPMDPRFVGWGGEDESWGLALRTLAGEPVRCRHDLIHLWHPPAERISRRVGSEANEELHQRYRAAHRQPAAMRALVDEAREVLREPDTTDDPRGHDHQRHAVSGG